MYYLKLTRWKNDGLAGFTASSVSSILVYWTNQRNEFGIKGTEKAVDSVGNVVGEGSESISNHISPKKWSW